MTGCNNNETTVKATEHVEYRLDKAVLVSRLKNIDSADVNVRYIQKTKYLFKKYSFNKIQLILHIKPEEELTDEFIEKQVKFNKLLLERELLNYFSYNGIIFEFYQNGKKVRIVDIDFQE